MSKFKRGDRVRKLRGSEWTGVIVGEYSTDMTPEGYCVESEHHVGSVQIYPAAALGLYVPASIAQIALIHKKSSISEEDRYAQMPGYKSNPWFPCDYVFPDGVRCIHGHNHLGIHVKPVGL